MAFARIFWFWSKGITELEAPPTYYSPFWKIFCERYYYDENLADILNLQFPQRHSQASAWFPMSSDELNIWEVSSTYIQDLVEPIVEELAAERWIPELPIIHVRLGDVPFVKSPFYQLPKYHFYEWVIEKSTYKHWVILTSLNASNANDLYQKLSREYLDDLLHYLENKGIQVTVFSERSVYDDIFSMIHTPLLITNMLSSFSYFWGINKSPGKFLCSKNHRMKFCPDWMYNKSSLLHDDIEDYSDTLTVFRQLRSD